MNRVLNATVQRTADHAAPEITLDPLEIVGGMHYLFTCLLFPHFVSLVLDLCTHSFCVSGICPSGEIKSSENTYFCQAARQLSCVPSSQLCVKLASGGDPTYAFNIRFTGEEVHGTS